MRELTTSYLYKDILELSSIRNSSRIIALLKALALQVGSEVSVAELGRLLGLSQPTVTSYLDLLEQSFIIFRLSAFNRNPRKEISKRDKIYFWDVGIRNSLLGNHLPVSERPDKGALWENFIIAERKKWLNYTESMANIFFWRTYAGSELDFVEEQTGKLKGYEIKFRKNPQKPPKAWIDQYGGDYQCITTGNYLDFLLADS